MKRQILLTVLSVLAFAPAVRAEQSGGLDWSAWQAMPVLQDGRIMPLDSFARVQVKKICGDAHPRLGKLGSKTNAEMSSLSPDEIKRLAEGRPRYFLAAELLYAWTIEPEEWDDVPFLIADDAALRTEVLDLPLLGEDGSRLRYVSPRQLRQAKKKFDKILAEADAVIEQAQKKKRRPIFTALQEKARNLQEARRVFLELRYDPGGTGDANRQLEGDLVGLLRSWTGFSQALSQGPALTVPEENIRMAAGKEVPQACLQAEKSQRELRQLVEKTDPAMREVVARWSSMETGKKPLQSIEPAAIRLRGLISDLDAKMHELVESDLPDPPILAENDADAIRSYRQNFYRWTKSLALQTAQLPWSLFSAGDEAIRIVPALEPTALEADRYRSEIHPWIGLQALLRGSPDLLHGYPAEQVEQARTAWRDARAAYLDRGSAEGARQFAEAMRQFTSDVRTLAVAIEPDRQQLPIIERDRGLLAKTAYPPAIVTDAEVFYNRVDPFRWSGRVSLIAALILGLSCLAGSKLSVRTGGLIFVASLGASAITYVLQGSIPSPLLQNLWIIVGPIGLCGIMLAVVLTAHGLLIRSARVERTYRNATFWLGVATLVVAVVFIAGGFVVRMYITHWAPVTSMFETVVWVSMCVSLLTLWLTFLPLLGPASKAAWDLTAIPGSWEERRRRDSAVSGPPESSQAGLRAVALAMRLALFVAGVFVGLCYLGVLGPDSGGPGYRLGAILPHADLGSSTPNLSASLVWAASMFVAVMFVWHLPRIIPAALLAIPISFARARTAEAGERMEKIYRWRVVALFGALASCLAAVMALAAPFPKDIQALMPVLRSNFWLGIHVLTIVTSYAGAGVAWVIGNLALGFFAFGRYRTVKSRRSPQLVVVAEAQTAGGSAEIETLDEVIAADMLDEGERRPPEFCGTLAWLNYRVLQVTVLLLAAGTILGGLWADVSWGRFWGWDPKEVGALIALVVILTALHGRRAGWHGDLSLAIGSVLGFAGVIWAWYVVNFILNAGLHSYGAGEGGQWIWLAAVGAVQLLFAGVAIARVMIETSASSTERS